MKLTLKLRQPSLTQQRLQLVIHTASLNQLIDFKLHRFQHFDFKLPLIQSRIILALKF